MKKELVLYSLPGCHPCEEVKAILQNLRKEYEFSLREVDISQDPGLQSKYGEIIPVLDFEGGGMLYGAFGEDEIRRELGKLQGK